MAALGLAVPADAQVFREAPSFPAGSRPTALVAADLDGDGALDLAVANASSEDLSILLGDGRGGFVTRSGPSVAAVGSLAVGDFDGDGQADLAAGGLTEAVLLRGDGRGGFAPGVACGHGGRVAVADVDADGRADLVGVQGRLAWLARGDGAGGCASALTFDAGLDLAAVASVDLDGDGRPELVLADRTAHAAVVLSFDGNGQPAAPVALPLGPGAYPAHVVAADFDGDGRTDVAVAAPGTGEILRLAADAQGRLGIVQRLALGVQAAVLQAADLDGNGRPDLAAADENAGDVLVVRTDAAGRWSAPEGGGGVGHGPAGLAVGDFDRDGRADVAIARRGGPVADGGVTLLRGDGQGGFPSAPPSLLVGRHPVALAAADLDGDGALDLVTANQVDGSLSLLRATPDGFDAARALAVAADARGVAVADFDADGWPDLAATHFAGGAMSLLRGTGGGGFGTPVAFGAGVEPYAVAPADFDGDGHLDVAVLDRGADVVRLLAGDGQGRFEDVGAHPVGHEPHAIAAADFDGDGRTDLAIANWGSASVSVLLGDGAGAFPRVRTLPAGAQTSGVAAADLDGDGHLDLVAANERLWEATGSVSLWPGDGAGDFGPPTTIAVGRGPYALALADLDRDGRPDIATANAFDRTVSILASGEGAAFERRADVPVGFAPAALVARDLDGDGRPDLAVTSAPPGRGRVRVLRNETPEADLALTVDDGATQAWPGRRVSYAITVTNRGPLAITALAVPIAPAPGLREVVFTASSGAYDPASGSWTGLDLQAGQQIVLTLAARLDAMATGSLVQSATVSGPAGLADPTPGDNAARDVDDVVPAADVSIGGRAAPDPVQLGEELTVSVRARNRGPLEAPAARVELEFPVFLEFLPWPASPSECREASGRVTCTLHDLAAGAEVALALKLRAGRALRATLRVSAWSAAFDPDARNDAKVLTVALRPLLGRELSHGFAQRGPAEGAWYRLRQEPRSSYEVVIDDAPLGAVQLLRVASDLQATLAAAPHAGGVRSLRLVNSGPLVVDFEALHVPPGVAHRIRAFETTGSFPRFDTRGDARTVVVLQNVGTGRVEGTLWFWDEAGSLRSARAFELPARGVGTFDAGASVPDGSGSITVTHDARHGDLAGKAATFDPVSGLVSEGLMVLRPR